MNRQRSDQARFEYALMGQNVLVYDGSVLLDRPSADPLAEMPLDGGLEKTLRSSVDTIYCPSGQQGPLHVEFYKRGAQGAENSPSVRLDWSRDEDYLD